MIKVAQIFNYLEYESYNLNDFEIKYPKPIDNLCQNCITFLTHDRLKEFITFFDSAPENVLAIVPKDLRSKSKKYNQTFIFSDNPMLCYMKVLNKFFKETFVSKISKTSVIETKKKIGKNLYIGENCSIRGDIIIGDQTIISDNVVINGNIIIGSNVRIKSGSIIGQKGFNFVYDENGIPIEFPHFGRVIIGDHVEIGALNTIVQGTLGDTIISDCVKTDDQVHIAHNVKIGYGTLITACAEISGSVNVGERVWLGPNCSLNNNITIGNNVFVGIGAVVTKSFPENVVVVGNPAKIIKERSDLEA